LYRYGFVIFYGVHDFTNNCSTPPYYGSEAVNALVLECKYFYSQ